MKQQLKTVNEFSLKKRTVKKLTSSELAKVMGGGSRHGCSGHTVITRE